MEAKHEGIFDGFHKGIHEGVLDGVQRALIRCLSTRFPSLPNALRYKIYGIREDFMLETIMDAVVKQRDLKSIKDMVDAALQLQEEYEKLYSHI
jgi:hypothetical protein